MSQRFLPQLLGPLLHRGDGRVQVGVEPGRSVVLDGPPPEQLEALRLLDGTRPVPAALATPEGATLLTLLIDRGLVVDAAARVAPDGDVLLTEEAAALVRVTRPRRRGYAATASRRASCVVVVGRGALPDGIAGVLRRAGVGEVRAGTEAAEDWDHEHAGRGPDLVVLIARHALDPRLGRPWRRRGIPVLPVVIGATEAVVGPLVAGGDRPCLDCLDHTRTDLDPAWPALLAQLTAAGVGAGERVGGEVALVAMAAAMAAMVALGCLDGQPQPAGRSLEAGLPWPGVRQRDWPVHPRCRCRTEGAGSPPASGDRDTARRPTDASGDEQARMAG